MSWQINSCQKWWLSPICKTLHVAKNVLRIMFWHTMTCDHLVGNLWQGMYGQGLDKTHWLDEPTVWKQMVPCQGGSPCPYSKADMLDCPGTKLTQSRVTSVPSPMGLQHRAEARGVTGSNSLPIVSSMAKYRSNTDPPNWISTGGARICHEHSFTQRVKWWWDQPAVERWDGGPWVSSGIT